LEAKKFELYEEDIDLAEVIQASTRLVAPQAEAGKCFCSTRSIKTFPSIRADEKRDASDPHQRPVQSVKFTPAGGSVCLTSARTDGSLFITVKDNGIGIAPDQIAKVVGTFWADREQSQRRHDGSGLGLPLAKQLIELHGGTLTIESAVNVGTSVILPCRPSASSHRTSAIKSPERNADSVHEPDFCWVPF